MALFQLLKIAIVVFPIHWILLTVYRLTLHPLAKYPGPFLWRISAWPDGLCARTGRRHLIHYELHQRYGHVVRIGPNKVSFDSQKAVHDIHTDRNANVIKSGHSGFSYRVSPFPHLQVLIDKKAHAQRRRIMAHSFSEAALKSAETLMLGAVRNWCNALLQGSDKATDGWSETKDLGHWTNLMTLDVLGELCFGYNFKAVDAGNHTIVNKVMRNTKWVQKIAYLPVTRLAEPLLRTERLLKFVSPRAYRRRWGLRKYLSDLVERRRQLEIDAEANKVPARKDFFHYVLKGRDPETGAMLPVASYTSEAALLVIAGTDTTSTALSACLFYLNQDRSKFDKLQQEVLKTFSSLESIKTGALLSSCVYLRACIDEAMRMTPPVPGNLTRKTLRGGATIDGHYIPGDIDVDTTIYAVMHNTDYYPDPFTFHPERWILNSEVPTSSGPVEVTEELLSQQRAAFIPFSTGPRNCLGINMAYMEMSLVMARLMFLFDMKFDAIKAPSKNATEFETFDWFTSGKEGPYLQFKLRDPKLREMMQSDEEIGLQEKEVAVQTGDEGEDLLSEKA